VHSEELAEIVRGGGGVDQPQEVDAAGAEALDERSEDGSACG
jgi:hypothetical protein